MWGIDVIEPEKRKEFSIPPRPRKVPLELLGLELCSFSEVTSGLIIGFLASNSLFISRECGLSLIQFTS